MILSKNFVKDYVDIDEDIDIKKLAEDMTGSYRGHIILIGLFSSFASMVLACTADVWVLSKYSSVI